MAAVALLDLDPDKPVTVDEFVANICAILNGMWEPEEKEELARTASSPISPSFESSVSIKDVLQQLSQVTIKGVPLLRDAWLHPSSMHDQLNENGVDEDRFQDPSATVDIYRTEARALSLLQQDAARQSPSFSTGSGNLATLPARYGGESATPYPIDNRGGSPSSPPQVFVAGQSLASNGIQHLSMPDNGASYEHTPAVTSPKRAPRNAPNGESRVGFADQVTEVYGIGNQAPISVVNGISLEAAASLVEQAVQRLFYTLTNGEGGMVSSGSVVRGLQNFPELSNLLEVHFQVEHEMTDAYFMTVPGSLTLTDLIEHIHILTRQDSSPDAVTDRSWLPPSPDNRPTPSALTPVQELASPHRTPRSSSTASAGSPNSNRSGNRGRSPLSSGSGSRGRSRSPSKTEHRPETWRNRSDEFWNSCIMESERSIGRARKLLDGNTSPKP